MATHPIDILLVEDNPGDVELLRIELDSVGVHHNLHVAPDGQTALEFLEQEGAYSDAPRPGVVLLDLNLPGINGHTVLRTIKSDEYLRTIPVIVLSSSSSSEDIEASYEDHANCYVTKPFDLDEMHTIVKALDRWWFKAAKLPPSEVR